jgi:hypothetical protein
MIVSILRRKGRIPDRARWETQLAGVMPKIRPVLERTPGFISVQYAWDVFGQGEFAQITTWERDEDCKRYVREGPAATIATLEEAAIPTALHPDGRWVRQTYEIVET